MLDAQTGEDRAKCGVTSVEQLPLWKCEQLGHEGEGLSGRVPGRRHCWSLGYLKELSARSTSGVSSECASFLEIKSLAFEERLTVRGSARGH